MRKSKRPAFALSAEYIEKLHDYLVSIRFAGTEPIAPGEPRNRGLIESAAHRPFQTAFGVEVYPTLVEKAAALFHSLIANHPFYNGNKRTAVLAVDHFLLANSKFLALPGPVMYSLARETATYRQRAVTHDQILNRIASEISSAAVSFSALRRQGLRLLHMGASNARAAIRKDRRNRPQPR